MRSRGRSEPNAAPAEPLDPENSRPLSQGLRLPSRWQPSSFQQGRLRPPRPAAPAPPPAPPPLRRRPLGHGALSWGLLAPPFARPFPPPCCAPPPRLSCRRAAPAPLSRPRPALPPPSPRSAPAGHDEAVVSERAGGAAQPQRPVQDRRDLHLHEQHPDRGQPLFSRPPALRGPHDDRVH